MIGVLLVVLLAGAALAAEFSMFLAHYEDGSSMQGTLSTRYGQDCYMSVTVRCPTLGAPCEATQRLQDFLATTPQCQYVQPPPPPQQDAPLAIDREARIRSDQ